MMMFYMPYKNTKEHVIEIRKSNNQLLESIYSFFQGKLMFYNRRI